MCVQLHLPASHYLSMGDFQLCSAMPQPCAWACSSRSSSGQTAAVPAVLSSCPESSWPPKPVSNVTEGWWVSKAPRCYLGSGVPGEASRRGPAVLGMAEEDRFTHKCHRRIFCLLLTREEDRRNGIQARCPTKTITENGNTCSLRK